MPPVAAESQLVYALLARSANREGSCSSRFGEGRFKFQRLINEVTILYCIFCVDLNLVRLGMADEPIFSQFISIYADIVACLISNRLKGLRVVQSATYREKQIER